MTTQAGQLPLQAKIAGLHRFTVGEYHRLFEIGILRKNEPLELLEGYLVLKMPKNPKHESSVDLANNLLNAHNPSGWIVRVGEVAAFSDSELAPDLAVARGTRHSYLSSYPGPADIGLVIEVSDSALAGDRADKGRVYARDGIGCYWIVNLQDNQIEVYTSPSGSTAMPAYTQRQDYRPGDAIPFVLDGVQIAAIPVHDLLP